MERLLPIIDVLKEKKSFLITGHIHPDGDSIGSQLALAHILKHKGKDVTIINNDPVPSAYRFLPGSETILSPRANIPPFFDAAVVLDCHEGKRLGEIEPLLKRVETVAVIDHHPAACNRTESWLGDIHFIDPSYSATGEIVYELIRKIDFKLNYVLAVNLYVSILTDTGSFKHSNTTPRVHRIIADLIEEGLNVEQIATLVYETNPLGLVQILGNCISTLKLAHEGKIAWTSISSRMLKDKGIYPEEIEGEKIIDMLRSIKSVQIAVLFRETGEKTIRVNLRSKNRIKVNQTAAIFGGGGHPKAAGCTLNESLSEAEHKVIGELKNLLLVRGQ